jgi:hypothetical protein
MSVQLKLPEVLAIVLDLYLSVEVRTLFTEVSGVPHNVFTVIQFSTLPASDCGISLRESLARKPLRNGGPLSFSWQRLDIDRWPSLADQLSAGRLQSEGVQVEIGREVELGQFMNSISSGPGQIGEPTSYPVFEASQAMLHATNELGRTLENIRYSGEVLRQLQRSGFHDFEELAAEYFGAARRSFSGASLIAFVAPVPLMVERVEVFPVEKKVRAHVRAHPILAACSRVMGDVQRVEWPQPVNKGALDFGPIPPVLGERTCTEAAIDEVSVDDTVQMRIVHDDLGIVHSQPFAVRRAVPPLYVNPLFETLNRFCPSADLRTMVTEPTAPPKDKGKNEGKVQRQFEQHIQWLLTCFGFAAVQLGANEYLYDADGEEGSKRRLGSLDLLAFHQAEQMLLLASCTMTPPKEEDLANLITLKVALAEELRKKAGIDVALAIFTNADRCVASPHYSGQDFVAVFDKPGVARLVDALASGDERWLFGLLRDQPQGASGGDPFGRSYAIGDSG